MKKDYVITVRYANDGMPYWSVTKKGEPHKCNTEEVAMVLETFKELAK